MLKPATHEFKLQLNRDHSFMAKLCTQLTERLVCIDGLYKEAHSK